MSSGHVTRRGAISAIGALAATIVAPLRAQGTFPSKPVRLIVPAAPGGLSDTVARVLSDALQADLRQPFVIDNRPGAAGLIGTQAVAEAPPDGYTLLVTSTSNHVVAPLTQKVVRVDPLRDLQPVALVMRAVGLLVVPASSPARTLAEFIALAKSKPGQLNYASAGIGSTNHVQMEMFKRLAQVDIVHVPYRGGGPLTSALMAGEVQFALLDFATAEAALKSGRVRALAQTGTRRHVALPDVPTLAEAGFNDYDPAFWIGVAAPKHTPPDVVGVLNAAINRALAQAALKARAQAFGWTLAGGAPAVLGDTAQRDASAYRELIAALQFDRQ